MNDVLLREKDQWGKSLAAWREILPFCLKVSVAGALLCYSVLLIYEYNTPDTIVEGTFLYVGAHWQEACGRWVNRLLNDFGGGIVMPAVSVAFNALCCAFAATLLAEWWEIKQRWAQALLALALISSPTMLSLSLYIYSYYSEGFTVAVFTFAAYLLFTKRGPSAYVGATVSICLGMATYQGDVGITAGLILMGLMIYCLEQRPVREIGLMTGKSLCVGALGFLSYYISIKLWVVISGRPLAARGGLSEMTPLSLLLGIPDRVRVCYHDFKEYFYILGTNDLGKILLACLLCAVVLLGIGVIKLALRKKPQTLLLILFGILLPLACNMIHLATDFEFNINTVIPMQYVVLFAVGLAARSQPLVFAGKWPARASRLITGCVVGYLCWVCCYTAYATYYTIGLSYRYADTLATGIINRVIANPEYTTDTRVLIGGTMDKTESQEFNLFREKSLYNGPMIIWNDRGGVLVGWMHYLYDYHGFFTGEIADAEYFAIVESSEYAAMPLYPAQGSIQKFGDIMVVKLQENPPL